MRGAVRTKETGVYMRADFKTVFIGNVSELVEKKSRFITTIRPAESEEAAIKIIEELRKKYWDASHNCYAYVIGKNAEIQRCSDDGEPSQTAGKPMLDVLLGEDIKNILVVVTRYFGGTLLGTGGLVRAYANAVKTGLEGCKIITKQQGIIFGIETDYTSLGKIQYILGSNSIPILESQYSDVVHIEIIIPIDEVPIIQEVIKEATNGKIILVKKKEQLFSLIDGEIVLFD